MVLLVQQLLQQLHDAVGPVVRGDIQMQISARWLVLLNKKTPATMRAESQLCSQQSLNIEDLPANHQQLRSQRPSTRRTLV